MRVGVAGVGQIGTVHAEALACRVPSARLAAVADADEQAAASAGARYGCPALAVDDLLTSGELDAVVLATPPATHADLVERAARAGKHVLCEKPLAYTVHEARDAVAACRAADVTLQVGFMRRFDPDFAACADAIRSGRLGSVRLLLATHRDRAPAVQTGHDERLVHDALCHDLDAGRWLMGEVEEVTAYAPSRHPGDSGRDVLIVLRFQNGVVGTIDGSREAGYGYECRLEVVGTRGTFRVGRSSPRSAELLEAGSVVAECFPDYLARFRGVYELELEHFAQVIRGAASPTATGDDGIRAAELAEAVDRSLAERIPVEVGS